MATGRVPTTANSPLTAKGDLFTYSTAPARLAVGNNGEQIVANSAASSGLQYNANFAAGKNVFLNGDFRINQRNFTSVTANGTYFFDRYITEIGGGTCTFTPQVFTPGTAPVAGYEGVNFLQVAISGQSGSSDYCGFDQRVEDVRTFAGQTVTLSFWAKASSGTPKIGIAIDQNFGSGGSASVQGTGQAITLSTSWARYSVQVSVPSISGKTIGTSSYLQPILWLSAGTSLASRAGSIGIQNSTFQIWGLQLEAGSVATAFQTATGTLQGELAACQRYYLRPQLTGAYTFYAVGAARSTTIADFCYTLPVSMRVAATAVDYSNAAIVANGVGATVLTNLIIDTPSTNQNVVSFQATVASGLTQFRLYFLGNNNNTAGYIGISAEL